MSYSVCITEQADRDLRGLYAYIAYELLSADNALGQLERLEAAIEGLAVFPERHALYRVEPWHSRGFRVMPVDNYCVFYMIDAVAMTVSVLRVLYMRRDLEKALRDDRQ